MDNNSNSYCILMVSVSGVSGDFIPCKLIRRSITEVNLVLTFIRSYVTHSNQHNLSV